MSVSCQYLLKISVIRKSDTMRKISFLIITFIISLITIQSCQSDETKSQTTEPSAELDTVLMLPALQNLTIEIKNNPNRPQLYYDRALKLQALQRFDLAYDDIKKAIELEGENPTFLYMLGNLAYENNEIAEATTALNRCLELDPKRGEAYQLLAKIQLHLTKYDDCKKTIDLWIERVGVSAETNFMSGFRAKYTGDTISAVRFFQKAVALDNDHYESYMQLGLLLGEKKDKLGIDYLNNALRIKEFSTEALYARGLLFQNLKEYDKAVKDYRAILDLNPEYAAAYYNIGEVNFAIERYELAIEAFNQAIIADEKLTRAYYMRGLCYHILGNLTEARRNYEACLKIDPNYGIAKEMMGMLGKPMG